MMTEPRLFVDPESFVSLQVPTGWLVDTSGQQGSRVILYHPATENNFRANVNVVVQFLAPLTADEYVILTRLQLKQFSGSASLLIDKAEQEPSGHVFEWSGQGVPIAPLPLKFRQRMVFASGKAFLITATAFLPQFERHRPDFEATLGSFRLLGLG